MTDGLIENDGKGTLKEGLAGLVFRYLSLESINKNKTVKVHIAALMRDCSINLMHRVSCNFQYLLSVPRSRKKVMGSNTATSC